MGLNHPKSIFYDLIKKILSISPVVFTTNLPLLKGLFFELIQNLKKTNLRSGLSNIYVEDALINFWIYSNNVRMGEPAGSKWGFISRGHGTGAGTKEVRLSRGKEAIATSALLLWNDILVLESRCVVRSWLRAEDVAGTPTYVSESKFLHSLVMILCFRFHSSSTVLGCNISGGASFTGKKKCS